MPKQFFHHVQKIKHLFHDSEYLVPTKFFISLAHHVHPLHHIANAMVIQDMAEQRAHAAQPERLPKLHGIDYVILSEDDSDEDSDIPLLRLSDSEWDTQSSQCAESDDEGMPPPPYQSEDEDEVDVAMSGLESAVMDMDNSISGLQGLVNDLENMCDDF